MTADKEKVRKFDASRPGEHVQGTRTSHLVRSQQNHVTSGHGKSEVKDWR